MAKKANKQCPNCGSELYEGWADGGILVCRDQDGGGCAMAVDPSELDGEQASEVMGPWAVEPSPVVGPPDEAPEPEPVELSPEQVVAIHEPFQTPAEESPSDGA